MAREKSYSEQLTEEYEQDWFDELNYKRTGHRNDAARELENLLREIERMTRPRNIYYKAKKKRKQRFMALQEDMGVTLNICKTVLLRFHMKKIIETKRLSVFGR